MRPCMGGFCAQRESCPHYSVPTYVGDINHPAERLCGPVDGQLKDKPDYRKESDDDPETDFA